MTRIRKRRKKQSIETKEVRELSSLMEGLQLESLQKEILILRKLKEFNTKSFKNFLREKNLDYRFNINKGKPSLTVDLTDIDIELSKKNIAAFQAIVNKDHWLTNLANFSSKEVLILIYTGRL